jgi:hypothetical protein
MRSTTYLAIALGTVWIAAAALADDSAPTTDSLAPMPPNPVTSPATGDKEPPAAPTKERHHGRDKQARQSDAASTATAGTAAPSTTTSAGAAADAAAQPPAVPKKICHSMDVAGSKIPKRVCATQEEWETYNKHGTEDTQDGLRRLQNQGAVAPASPGVSASQLPPG